MDMDWAAIKDSEIMTSYLRGELAKEASCRPPVVKQEDVLRDFEKFEAAVKEDAKLRFTFKKLQEKFADDPEYTSKVNPKFVEGVMLLDLDQE